MTFTAVFKQAIRYRVGPILYASAPTVSIGIVAESPLAAERTAQRIAADRGWCLLDVRGEP